MSLKQINPKKAYYIKLGSKGKLEKDCIEVSQTLRLGYKSVPDALCREGKWDEVKKILQKENEDVGGGVATRHTNQIRRFYEADDSALWTTFFGDKLYWCFSKPEITLLSDGSKTRRAIGQWHSDDIFDKPLQKTQLSGALLQMQGFRGTNCEVKEIQYLVQKINGLVCPEVDDAIQTKAEFIKKIETLIPMLTWEDFELLIDMLFRQAGCQRMSPLGKIEKTIDLDLYSPISDKRFLVQVKSKANLKKLQDFKEHIINFDDYDCAYFIVHSPENDLVQMQKFDEDVEVWLCNDVANRVVMYGLADWVIKKVSLK